MTSSQLSSDEMQAKFDALQPGVADAIDAAMLFFDTMEKHPDISIRGLADGLSLAMESGHDRAELFVTMLSFGIRLSAEALQ